MLESIKTMEDYEKAKESRWARGIVESTSISAMPERNSPWPVRVAEKAAVREPGDT